MIKLKVPRVVKQWAVDKEIKPVLTNAIPNGYGRRYSVNPTHVLTKEAFLQFNLENIIEEPRYKTFIGNHFLDGAYTHVHTDHAPEGYEHVRCNVLVKKPTEGGNPILDDVEISVEENDLWICLASLEKHSTTPIKGGERIIVSFGALVPKEELYKIIQY